MPLRYAVYILASGSRELYVGITNDLTRCLAEHRAGLHPDSYAHRQETIRLVHVEFTSDVRVAIQREKQIKGWKRRRKIELIEDGNPDWRDLGVYISDDGGSAPSLRSG
ncbi:MAG: GIY-YIG nuclease family protein [Gemmatimonadales bacterium]